jgi:hypothetical protein
VTTAALGGRSGPAAPSTGFFISLLIPIVSAGDVLPILPVEVLLMESRIAAIS